MEKFPQNISKKNIALVLWIWGRGDSIEDFLRKNSFSTLDLRKKWQNWWNRLCKASRTFDYKYYYIWRNGKIFDKVEKKWKSVSYSFDVMVLGLQGYDKIDHGRPKELQISRIIEK